MKFPKTLGKCIDLVFTTRESRKALEAEVEALKREEEQIKDHLLQAFGASKISGAKGSLCNASIVEKDTPTAGDWEKIYEHIKKTGQFDLLQRRLGEAACQARWENGESIPGVEKFHKVTINITKK